MISYINLFFNQEQALIKLINDYKRTFTIPKPLKKLSIFFISDMNDQSVTHDQ